MKYDIRLQEPPRMATAVIAEKTTWQEFPRIWPLLLTEVRATPGIPRAALNVFVYRDDAPSVEVGVVTDVPFVAKGRVVSSRLPAGKFASTIHRGRYQDLGAAHDAVTEWCKSHGHKVTGVRWEVYGHWSDNPDELETEVCWQVRT